MMKHHFLRTGSNDVDSELELVRKGFDPSQVQQLVGQLSAELKTVAAENDRLRGRMAELEAAPPPPPAPGAASTDIFAHWSKETNDLLDAARASISSVTEKATTDAAAAVAAGETAANAIRQRAQLDAEGVMADELSRFSTAAPPRSCLRGSGAGRGERERVAPTDDGCLR